MRVLILLLFTFHSLLSLATAHDSSLIQWRDTLHFDQQPHDPVTATKTWKLCALYPSLKDSYWLSINYGMQKAAKHYGIDLNVLEAGGYNQLATQQKQITQCQQWGADAILLGSSTTTFPNLSQLVENTPVIEVINATHDKTIKTRVGVPWFQMGYQPGRYLVQWSQGKPLKVLLMPGPLNAGGSHEMEQGFREAIAGS